ncbi:SRPBCC family protein [Lederbergia lenta]|uniref:Activator of Hsp90 ATPase homolog 1-like protein n=1 Tax=Lederbergia lenta TaxID=1467 RepID=A0A2X4W4I2_LEDLE|nr:SRPBCC domain-containing protein [Lederbergia lenta]MCM3109410.1 SRPBCC domain-containing protein [Lederbergia lenta]MEC2324824.1 SRPBCC domain-containing protein [Lederbergia lenta]SQI57599.1 Activator of Hsp90 ATPase homolog 1-like protein [Lederbergia lenta]
MEKDKQNTAQDVIQMVIFDAPIEKVWEKVSTSEGIESWFMPNDFQLKQGHEFHLQSPFGPSPCKVIEIEVPNRLSFTWDTDGWIVSFILKDLGGKTEFTLIHSGWKDGEAIVPKAGEKVSIIRERMNKGWTGIIEKLRKIVEG